MVGGLGIFRIRVRVLDVPLCSPFAEQGSKRSDRSGEIPRFCSKEEIVNELELVEVVEKVESSGVSAWVFSEGLISEREVELANLELDRRGAVGRVVRAPVEIDLGRIDLS